MTRPTSYRKTGLDRADPRAYSRAYYAKFVKKIGVDGRSLRASDWLCEARKQAAKAAKNRGIPFRLTSEDLRKQWVKQQGRCFYTGLAMTMDLSRFRGPMKPSIDRVNSGLGYEPNNIVFCLTAINYLKCDYDALEVCELLHAIVDEYR